MKRWLWSNWLVRGKNKERERKIGEKKKKKYRKREEPYRGELRVARNVHKESREEEEGKIFFVTSSRALGLCIPGGVFSLFLFPPFDGW